MRCCAASGWEDTVLDLAIATALTGEADIGDSYEFTLRVQLPSVATTSPLSVLIREGFKNSSSVN